MQSRPPPPRRRPTRAQRRRARDRRGLLAAFGGVAGVLLLAALYLLLLGAPPSVPDPIGGPFRLVASDGRQVTERSFPGRFLLVYFGYSHCRDVCPATLASLALALDTMGADAARVQPLFITVDPRRDTPPVLARYLAEFSPRLLGLSGSAQQLDQVLRAYRVHVAPASAGQAIEHSSVLYLIDPAGGFVAPIRADAPAATMAAELVRHLS